MPNILIVNLFGKLIKADEPGKSVLQHLHSNGVDWMHSCGGKGRCTTCKFIVRAGSDNLPPLNTAEERYKSMGALADDERLSCQVILQGDITIQVPDEYKLPHVQYGQ
jgi:ferredoxin, 2Fe-2S